MTYSPRMHELSLCRAIVDTVTNRAAGRAVRSVHLSVGHFRQVVPDTLRFCWDLSVEHTDLAGCELVVDHIPALIICRDCGCQTTLDMPMLVCAGCDGTDVDLVSGEEFLIESIDVVRS